MAKRQFAAVPLPAMGDRRLHGQHFRLLCAISYHDRFGKNGSGCYATHDKLAEEANVAVTNIPQLARDLETWGHLLIEENLTDRRKKIYRLTFGSARASEFPSAGTSDRRDGTHAPARANGENSVVRSPKFTSAKTDQVAETADDFSGRELRDSAKQIKIDSAKQRAKNARHMPTRISEDWRPTQRDRDYCKQKWNWTDSHIDSMREIFVDHFLAEPNGERRNWSVVFRRYARDWRNQDAAAFTESAISDPTESP